MKKRKILHALIYAVLTLGALLVFFPFYLTVVSSLKDMSDIFSNFFGQFYWETISIIQFKDIRS